MAILLSPLVRIRIHWIWGFRACFNASGSWAPFHAPAVDLSALRVRSGGGSAMEMTTYLPSSRSSLSCDMSTPFENIALTCLIIFSPFPERFIFREKQVMVIDLYAGLRCWAVSTYGFLSLAVALRSARMPTQAQLLRSV